MLQILFLKKSQMEEAEQLAIREGLMEKVQMIGNLVPVDHCSLDRLWIIYLRMQHSELPLQQVEQ